MMMESDSLRSLPWSLLLLGPEPPHLQAFLRPLNKAVQSALRPALAPVFHVDNERLPAARPSAPPC